MHFLNSWSFHFTYRMVWLLLLISRQTLKHHSEYTEQVSPMVSIPLGVLEHRFFHTEILVKCLQYASQRFCIEVTVHVVVGLEWIWVRAYSNLGLTFRAHISLHATWPAPPKFVPSVLEPRNWPVSSSLVPSLQEDSECSPWWKKNPTDGGPGSQLHIHLSCLFPIDSPNYDDGEVVEFTHPNRYQFNHN